MTPTDSGKAKKKTSLDSTWRLEGEFDTRPQRVGLAPWVDRQDFTKHHKYKVGNSKGILGKGILGKDSKVETIIDPRKFARDTSPPPR